MAAKGRAGLPPARLIQEPVIPPAAGLTLVFLKMTCSEWRERLRAAWLRSWASGLVPSAALAPDSASSRALPEARRAPLLFPARLSAPRTVPGAQRVLSKRLSTELRHPQEPSPHTLAGLSVSG